MLSRTYLSRPNLKIKTNKEFLCRMKHQSNPQMKQKQDPRIPYQVEKGSQRLEMASCSDHEKNGRVTNHWSSDEWAASPKANRSNKSLLVIISHEQAIFQTGEVSSARWPARKTLLDSEYGLQWSYERSCKTTSPYQRRSATRRSNWRVVQSARME